MGFLSSIFGINRSKEEKIENLKNGNNNNMEIVKISDT